jgi:hypothetical protein
LAVKDAEMMEATGKVQGQIPMLIFQG